MFLWNMFHAKQRHPQAPRPRNSSVPSSRSSQSSGLCPKTLLVSVRLGGGAATRRLVTDHQKSEQERRSNQTVRLRALGPDALSQSGLYIRKQHHAGFARCRPVRRQAPSLPSGVTRRQSAGGQTPVPAQACNTRPVPVCEPIPSALWLCRVCVRVW